MSKYKNVEMPQTSAAKEQLKPGTYTARIYQILDLGTQKSVFQGQETFKRKFRISFETPTQKTIFNEEKGEQPFSLSMEVNYLLTDQNSATQSWLTKIFTAVHNTNGKGRSIFDLLGGLLTIQVEQNEKGYSNITGVSPLHSEIDRNDKRLKPINEQKELYLDPEVFGDEEMQLINSLPNFIKDKINASPEFLACIEADDIDLEEEKSTPQMPF